MTAQNVGELPPATLAHTVVQRQVGLVVEVTVADGSVHELTLTQDDLELAGWHENEQCPDPDFVHDACPSPHYEELLEGVVDDLHRLAHNTPGDRDTAAECLRYPCRRLGT